jgi:hypothetical protein
MRVASEIGRSAFSPRRLVSVLVVLAVGVCPACSSGRKPVYPVHGQVRFQGKPANHAQITFHPVNDKSPDAIRPVGIVDEQGNFTLTSYKQGDGAPEGEYQVTIQWFLAVKTQTRAGSDYVSVNHLPIRYARADTSGLRVSIAKGKNEIPPFELTTK